MKNIESNHLKTIQNNILLVMKNNMERINCR